MAGEKIWTIFCGFTRKGQNFSIYRFENGAFPKIKAHFQNGKWGNFVPSGSAIIAVAGVCHSANKALITDFCLRNLEIKDIVIIYGKIKENIVKIIDIEKC